LVTFIGKRPKVKKKYQDELFCSMKNKKTNTGKDGSLWVTSPWQRIPEKILSLEE